MKVNTKKLKNILFTLKTKNGYCEAYDYNCRASDNCGSYNCINRIIKYLSV